MAPGLTGPQKGKIALLFYVDIIVFALMSSGWQTLKPMSRRAEETTNGLGC